MAMSRLSRRPLIWFGWYYIALHPENARRLLTSQPDLAACLRILSATLQKQEARLYGGYVGETEIHLALQTDEKSASAFTAVLSHKYARLFNRTHKAKGPLFKPHAHMLMIQQPRWLIPLVRNIHGLPQTASDSVWRSSDAVYRRGARMNGLVTTDILRPLSRSRNHQSSMKPMPDVLGRRPIRTTLSASCTA